MEKIVVNKSASKSLVEEAYRSALADIKRLAATGQTTFIVSFSLPNYADGCNVLEMLEEHGVKCQERGFGSSVSCSGSYHFNIKLKLQETEEY